ncbi:hypothetical protein NQ318_007752 [Aromia moschata]|uniref:RNA-directed DNA polymerase n=1 Tax=Aromia moschata TaxID=1265417 RepID=A0AAV8Z1J1_9CUCU|nr:hypothetical protein NQ318_007752 [Aromia moschata]
MLSAHVFSDGVILESLNSPESWHLARISLVSITQQRAISVFKTAMPGPLEMGTSIPESLASTAGSVLKVDAPVLGGKSQWAMVSRVRDYSKSSTSSAYSRRYQSFYMGLFPLQMGYTVAEEMGTSQSVTLRVHARYREDGGVAEYYRGRARLTFEGDLLGQLLRSKLCFIKFMVLQFLTILCKDGCMKTTFAADGCKNSAAVLDNILPGKYNLEADCLSRNPVLEPHENQDESLKFINLIKLEDIYNDQETNEDIQNNKDGLEQHNKMYQLRILGVQETKDENLKDYQLLKPELLHFILSQMAWLNVTTEPYAITCLNSSQHESTTYTPSMLTSGREMKLPADLILGRLLEENQERSLPEFIKVAMQRENQDAQVREMSNQHLYGQHDERVGDIKNQEQVHLRGRQEQAEEGVLHVLDSSNETCNKLLMATTVQVEDGWLSEELKKSQKKDNDLRLIRNWVKNGVPPTWQEVSRYGTTIKGYWAQWNSLCLRDGLLQRKWESPDGVSTVYQLVLPKARIHQVLEELHSSPTGGHFGVTRTLARVRDRFYWENCRRDVEEWQMKLPADLILGRLLEENQERSLPEFVEDLRERMDRIHRFAREKLKIHSDKMKQRLDITSTDTAFEPGGAVWLYAPKRMKGRSPKLQKNWEGPYTIIKKINDLVYRIQLSPRSKPKVVYLEWLAKYTGHNPPDWFVVEDPPPRTEGSVIRDE